MNIFYKDIKNNHVITWDELINDINGSLLYNIFCKTENYYQVFHHIILSMIIGEEVILLDSDFTDSELNHLTGSTEFVGYTRNINNKNDIVIKDKTELIEKIRKTSVDWKVTLFTSGTTGTPKKVTHTFQSISRFVKISNQNSNSVWGFAYNPTHMAGIQVFLQALLNGNSIIRLFGLSPNDIYGEIKENKISHISATPTFYRLLLPCSEIFPSVKRITSGGEKFNKKMTYRLHSTFPNAKIKNIYASTEAGTLFASDNDTFSVKPEYHNLIKVENCELLIHSSLMGISELNVGQWYHTGDLIEIVSENPLSFRFNSRKGEMINVGGYKVNPYEVEEAVQAITGIRNVRVFSKSNSVLGNIICCEVVCEDDKVSESQIRSILKSKLQEHKIPRIIHFVDELSTTRTGKIKRN